MLKAYLKNYPVYITLEPEVLQDESSTLIVGWEYIKKHYPNQNIFDKQIYESNIHWAFSNTEEKSALQDVKEFVNKQLMNWLPSDFKVYDPLFNGSLTEYANKHFDFTKNTYVHYNNGALYVNNSGQNFTINIKTLFYASEKYVNEVTALLNRENVICFSYYNIDEIVNLEDITNPSFESIYWVKFGVEIDEDKQFNIIPNFNYQKYVPFFMNFMGIPELDKEDLVFAQRMVKRDKITQYCSTREISTRKDLEVPGKTFVSHGKYNTTKIRFSNKRTLTNRVVAKDVWNIQNETKGSDRRKGIISRFEGGKILVCDYQSFETWISIYLTKNDDFINYFKGKDIHMEVAKRVYQKESISSDERTFAKILNHAMLYGASYNRLVGMISEKGIPEPKERLYFVERLLKPIIENSKTINEQVKKVGYAVTAWGSIVKPDKSYAAYNNLVQTTASEIMIDKVENIIGLLEDKESEFMFQVHDSLVFDISPRDKGLMAEILTMLSFFNNSYFPITYSFGDNYLELSNEKRYIPEKSFKK